MPYTLNTPSGMTILSALCVNEAASGVQDLVAANTIATDGAVTISSNTYRGTSRPYFQCSGTGFSPQGITWTGTKPNAVLADGTQGLWFFSVIDGWGAGAGAGGTNERCLWDVLGSQRLEVRVGDTNQNMGRYSTTFYTSANANQGNVQSAYWWQARYANSGSTSRTAGGTFAALDTNTDGGFMVQDGLLERYGGNFDTWWQPRTYIAVCGKYDTDVPSSLPSIATLDSWADDWFATFISTGGGGGSTLLRKFNHFMRA
jgi:hypothetical protein